MGDNDGQGAGRGKGRARGRGRGGGWDGDGGRGRGRAKGAVSGKAAQAEQLPALRAAAATYVGPDSKEWEIGKKFCLW